MSPKLLRKKTRLVKQFYPLRPGSAVIKALMEKHRDPTQTLACVEASGYLHKVGVYRRPDQRLRLKARPKYQEDPKLLRRDFLSLHSHFSDPYANNVESHPPAVTIGRDQLRGIEGMPNGDCKDGGSVYHFPVDLLVDALVRQIAEGSR
jgi:hypothetical protein